MARKPHPRGDPAEDCHAGLETRNDGIQLGSYQAIQTQARKMHSNGSSRARRHCQMGNKPSRLPKSVGYGRTNMGRSARAETALSYQGRLHAPGLACGKMSDPYPSLLTTGSPSLRLRSSGIASNLECWVGILIALWELQPATRF